MQRPFSTAENECGLPSLSRLWALLATVVLFCSPAVRAETTDPRILIEVKKAVQAELVADSTDKMPWHYRDHDIQPGKDAVYEVVETPRGDLKRLLVLNGKTLTGADAQQELDRLRTFVNSPAEQAKKKKSSDSDDRQARAFLSMLPDAFVWTLVKETPEAFVLRFQPNPDFSPPDLQARILGVLAGEMLIVRNGSRIQSLRGTLTDDVKIGFGLFGKIEKGGTFNIERRELLPGHWQITETHVHIGGHALLFKTIGQQEDEVMTEWKPSTAPNLQAALQQLQH